MASENFRKHCPTDPVERQRQARDLFTKFFERGAKDELNVDEDVRERVRAQLSSPTSETFFEAQQFITSLLQYDCFPKFARSPFYVRYQEQYALKQAQREEIKLRQSQRSSRAAPDKPLQHRQTLVDTQPPPLNASASTSSLPPSPSVSLRKPLPQSEGKQEITVLFGM